jgi:hypothetical protein
MSAFPESGRSNTPKTAETKVRFRPKAAFWHKDFYIIKTLQCITLSALMIDEI